MFYCYLIANAAGGENRWWVWFVHERRLRERIRIDDVGHGYNGRSVPGFLPIRVRSLDSHEPHSGRQTHLGYVRPSLAGQSDRHENNSRWDFAYNLINLEYYIQLFITEQPAESLVSEAEKRAQRYYQSCLDVNETMEALGGKPVLDLLVQIGGWSAIELPNAEAEKRWNFQHALQTAHNVMNMGGFFTWAVAEDDKNSSRHVIQVNKTEQIFYQFLLCDDGCDNIDFVEQMDQSGLTLPNRDYYLNKTESDEILVAYLDYVTKVSI